MEHLLLTRFQGAAIGARTIYLTAQQLAPNQLAIDTTPALIGGIDSLIRCGGFDLHDWIESTKSPISRPQQAILAMLPLMLFFHDDRLKLRSVLASVSHGWQLDWETCSSAVILGYIISRSLTESLTPRTTISQLLAETNNLCPLAYQELETIDRLLTQSSSLRQVQQQLTRNPHPIVTPTSVAIYCFLATPGDFGLAMLRAHRTEAELPFVCALTGILAGAYNSRAGIPLNGAIATPDSARLLTATADLLGAWAGVYRDASSQIRLNYALAVAAPYTIQPRK